MKSLISVKGLGIWELATLRAVTIATKTRVAHPAFCNRRKREEKMYPLHQDLAPDPPVQKQINSVSTNDTIYLPVTLLYLVTYNNVFRSCWAPWVWLNWQAFRTTSGLLEAVTSLHFRPENIEKILEAVTSQHSNSLPIASGKYFIHGDNLRTLINHTGEKSCM